MSAIIINQINPLDLESYFTEPFEFEIDFNCLRDLENELEWNVHLIAQNSEYDSHLDRILMGPISSGRHLFNLRVDPPDYKEIPQEEWIKTMFVIVSCKYKNQEHIRIGYFVQHEYSEIIESGSCAYNDRLNPNLVIRKIITEYPFILTYPAFGEE